MKSENKYKSIDAERFINAVSELTKEDLVDSVVGLIRLMHP